MDQVEKRNRFITQIVSSVILMAVGIAFCFSISEATALISTILGVVVIVSGAILLTVTILVNRAGLTIQGLVAALLIALGIFTILKNPVQLVVEFVPFALLSFGGLLVIDAFLRFFWKKKTNTFVFVMTLVAGSIVIALGICFLTIPEFSQFAGIVLGIVLIVYGAANLIMTLAKNKKDKKEEK